MANDDLDPLTLAIRMSPEERAEREREWNARLHPTDEDASRRIKAGGAPTLATQLVTLTEGATWLAFEVALTPAQWAKNLGHLRDIVFELQSAFAHRGTSFPLDVRFHMSQVSKCWDAKVAQFEIAAQEASEQILQQARIGTLVLHGKGPGSNDVAPLTATNYLPPLRPALEKNALVFDDAKAREVSSSFDKQSVPGWTDIMIRSDVVRKMRGCRPAQASGKTADEDRPNPKTRTSELVEWAERKIRDAQQRHTRYSKREFEDLAIAELSLKREAARALFEQTAPSDWQRLGRPVKSRRN